MIAAFCNFSKTIAFFLVEKKKFIFYGLHDFFVVATGYEYTNASFYPHFIDDFGNCIHNYKI